MKKAVSCIGILALLDQITKYFIKSNFTLGESKEILPFFHLVFAANTGIAFSMFQGANTFFIGFTLLILAGIGIWYTKNKEQLSFVHQLSLVLVVSGALGNVIDRIIHGFVIDFLDVSIGTYHWPAFNVADSCISIGAVLLAVSLLLLDQSPKKVKAQV
jgi:signal peptidase II